MLHSKGIRMHEKPCATMDYVLINESRYAFHELRLPHAAINPSVRNAMRIEKRCATTMVDSRANNGRFAALIKRLNTYSKQRCPTSQKHPPANTKRALTRGDRRVSKENKPNARHPNFWQIAVTLYFRVQEIHPLTCGNTSKVCVTALTWAFTNYDAKYVELQHFWADHAILRRMAEVTTGRNSR